MAFSLTDEAVTKSLLDYRENFSFLSVVHYVMGIRISKWALIQ